MATRSIGRGPRAARLFFEFFFVGGVDGWVTHHTSFVPKKKSCRLLTVTCFVLSDGSSPAESQLVVSTSLFCFCLSTILAPSRPPRSSPRALPTARPTLPNHSPLLPRVVPILQAVLPSLQEQRTSICSIRQHTPAVRDRRNDSRQGSVFGLLGSPWVAPSGRGFRSVRSAW